MIVEEPTWGGDMPLLREQLLAIERQLNMSESAAAEGSRGIRRRKKRQVFRFDKFSTNIWPQLITFKVDKDFTNTQHIIIHEAISAWEEATCIDFKHVDYTDNVTKQHLVFVTAHSGWVLKKLVIIE